MRQVKSFFVFVTSSWLTFVIELLIRDQMLHLLFPFMITIGFSLIYLVINLFLVAPLTTGLAGRFFKFNGFVYCMAISYVVHAGVYSTVVYFIGIYLRLLLIDDFGNPPRIGGGVVNTMLFVILPSVVGAVAYLSISRRGRSSC